jgi:hypothetical protein
MKIGVLVNEGPFTHQASDSAYHFTKAAIEKGHDVMRVFFYYDGVNNANKLSEPQSDDRNLVKMWRHQGRDSRRRFPDFRAWAVDRIGHGRRPHGRVRRLRGRT